MACVTAELGAQSEPLPEEGSLIKRTYTSAIDGAAVDYVLWLPPGYESPSCGVSMEMVGGSSPIRLCGRMEM